ncbi:uncharacterized protein LOC142163198 [Nicotiana tabacum]|uniref:Uncharacterized protein LOC142163198 n=1 Tax=Nicotiana tabacum TaxID=4097 RepID=A0AC58RV07_TOBAC
MYFTKLKGYWDEIGNFTFGRPCTCGALPEFIEGQKLVQFLSGLNDTYGTVRSDILMMSPVTSVAKAYSILIRDEKQREIKSDSPMFSSDSASFLANSPAPLICLSQKYCKKSGHTVAKCYKLHGFPSDFKFTKNKRVAASVHMDFTPETPPLSDPQQVVDAPHDFSKEQYAHILSPFSRPNSHPLFQHHHHHLLLMPILTGPSLKRPLEIGRVKHGLYILYMGFRKSNFVSIHYSDVKSSDCSFHSVISPVPSSLVIDSSVLPTSCTSTSINKNDILWHQRMRHIPFGKMISIPHLSCKFYSKQSFVCPICPIARQQRNSFPASITHSSRPFELVHIDLWGPYHTATYNGFKYLLTIVYDYSRVTWTHLL